MKQTTCGSCIYFRQHYILNQRNLVRVYCGHCTNMSPKHKRPDSKVCDKYQFAAPAENPFVSKEYLSKALLDYMLHLDLLPEICDSES